MTTNIPGMRGHSTEHSTLVLIPLLLIIALVVAACAEDPSSTPEGETAGEGDTTGEDEQEAEDEESDPDMPFPEGTTLSVITDTAEGGGHDTIARILAQHIPNHVPGDVNVRVENLDGSEGIEAHRHLADDRTPRDGSVIMTAHRRWISRDVAGEGSEFLEPREQVIGSLRRRESSHLVWVRQDVCTEWYECVERDEPLTFGEADPGGGSSMGPAMAYIVGANVDIIYGYEGTAEVAAAHERGEFEAQGSGAGSIPANDPHLCEEEIVYPVAQWGAADALVEEAQWCWDTLGISEEPPELEELLELSDEEALLLEIVADTVELARGTYYVPPDTPDEVREWWIDKLEEIANDPEYIEDVLAAGYARDEFGYSPPDQLVDVLSTFESLAEEDPDAVRVIRMLQGLDDLERIREP